MVQRPNEYSYASSGPFGRVDPYGLYDIAGHFWTTYLVATAAGVNNADAYKLAYYSQLPDQTQFTDAAAQGYRHFFGVDDKDWTANIDKWLHSMDMGDKTGIEEAQGMP